MRNRVHAIVTSCGEACVVRLIARLCEQMNQDEVIISIGVNTPKGVLASIESMKHVHRCLRHYELDGCSLLHARNMAAEMVPPGEWVVALDADEFIGKPFMHEIRNEANLNDGVRCIYLQRLNVMHKGDERIPNINWANVTQYRAWPDYQRRLYKAGQAKWGAGDSIHEFLDCGESYAISQNLDTAIIHIRNETVTGGGHRATRQSLDIRTPPLFTRPQHNAWDIGIFDEVVKHNCYRLPSCFTDDDFIIDLGGHIGSFVHACVIRGARRVVSVEADRRNFEKLCENSSMYPGRVNLIHAAAWRSDTGKCKLGMIQFDQSNPESNTGGGTCCCDVNENEVETIGLDEIIGNIGRPVRFLKLDIEGAEYPVIYTASKLCEVQQIALEYHSVNGMRQSGIVGPDNSGLGMERFLKDKGFYVVRTQNNEWAGYIHAWNKSWV